MKVRTNCEHCRKEIYKEAEEAYLKQKYSILNENAYTMAVFSTAAVLAVMHRRGRSKRYIRKLFDEICFMYDYPAYMGKELHMTEVMKLMENEYGIDFRKIKIHTETEKQFLYGARKEKEVRAK